MDTIINSKCLDRRTLRKCSLRDPHLHGLINGVPFTSSINDGSETAAFERGPVAFSFPSSQPDKKRKKKWRAESKTRMKKKGSTKKRHGSSGSLKKKSRSKSSEKSRKSNRSRKLSSGGKSSKSSKKKSGSKSSKSSRKSKRKSPRKRKKLPVRGETSGAPKKKSESKSSVSSRAPSQISSCLKKLSAKDKSSVSLIRRSKLLDSLSKIQDKCSCFGRRGNKGSSERSREKILVRRESKPLNKSVGKTLESSTKPRKKSRCSLKKKSKSSLKKKKKTKSRKARSKVRSSKKNRKKKSKSRKKEKSKSLRGRKKKRSKCRGKCKCKSGTEVTSKCHSKSSGTLICTPSQENKAAECVNCILLGDYDNPNMFLPYHKKVIEKLAADSLSTLLHDLKRKSMKESKLPSPVVSKSEKSFNASSTMLSMKHKILLNKILDEGSQLQRTSDESDTPSVYKFKSSRFLKRKSMKESTRSKSHLFKSQKAYKSGSSTSLQSALSLDLGIQKRLAKNKRKKESTSSESWFKTCSSLISLQSTTSSEGLRRQKKFLTSKLEGLIDETNEDTKNKQLTNIYNGNYLSTFASTVLQAKDRMIKNSYSFGVLNPSSRKKKFSTYSEQKQIGTEKYE